MRLIHIGVCLAALLLSGCKSMEVKAVTMNVNLNVTVPVKE